MIAAINQKLENGWSPFYEDSNVKYKSVSYCADLFLKYQEKEVSDGVKREDTLRTYKSCLSMFKNYVENQNVSIKFIIEIDTYFIRNYLDYMYFDRKCSPSTYNNHLLFLDTFLEWCKNKKIVTQNATDGIKKKPKNQKKREVLTDEVKAKVRELRQTDFHYFVLCMVTYYCFIRRTELTKIKVSDVNLKKGFILVNAENSKNHKTEAVTIPNMFLPDFALHLASAKNTDYVFSANNFKPGSTQLTPKKYLMYGLNLGKKKGLIVNFNFIR